MKCLIGFADYQTTDNGKFKKCKYHTSLTLNFIKCNYVKLSLLLCSFQLDNTDVTTVSLSDGAKLHQSTPLSNTKWSLRKLQKWQFFYIRKLQITPTSGTHTHQGSASCRNWSNKPEGFPLYVHMGTSNPT